MTVVNNDENAISGFNASSDTKCPLDSKLILDLHLSPNLFA